MSQPNQAIQEKKTDKELYEYQQGAISKIFEKFDTAPSDYHLLYQLPTGGGKTVIFSEMVRQYLKNHNKKVLVMTHRIELCNQTSKMLTSFGVTNKVVNSKANLDDQAEYSCFVAMVETLNNRLNDNMLDISDVGQKTEIAAPLAYAFRIADSIILKEARLARRVGEMPEAEPQSETPGPEQRVDYQQRLARFQTALSEMPKLRRTVFVKRHLGDQSRAEIAKELGISVESVKKHLVRARQELARVSVEVELSARVQARSEKKGAA